MLALLLGVLFQQQFDRIRAAEFAEKALLRAKYEPTSNQ